MAYDILRNMGQLSGTYDGEQLDVYSTELETTLVDGIDVAKTANKDLWANGTLTYTITITNTTGIDVLDASFIDVLDITRIDLVTGSVKLGGVTVPYTFDLDGTLTVPNLTISDTPVIITFDVVRV